MLKVKYDDISTSDDYQRAVMNFLCGEETCEKAGEKLDPRL